MCVVTQLTDELNKQGTESSRGSYRGVALATSVQMSHKHLLWSAFIKQRSEGWDRLRLPVQAQDRGR